MFLLFLQAEGQISSTAEITRATMGNPFEVYAHGRGHGQGNKYPVIFLVNSQI